MQFVIKYRWALVGTFFLHLGVLLYMNSIPVPPPYQPMGELTQIPIVLEQVENPEREEEKARPEQEQQNGKVSNITANERDKVGETPQRYDARNLDEQVEKELREFEKSAFEELASGRKTEITLPAENDKTKVKDKTNEHKTNATDAGKVRSPGRVAGSYDLGGRTHENFVKPAYVCKGSGTVVLKIKVNRNGKVVAAEIDESASSYSESCMGENSLTYVRKCKFEAGTQWPDPQSGTVTYTFIAQ